MTFSPSHLNKYVECEHLLQLELRVGRGDMPRPDDRSEHADLLAAKGDAHEAAYLAALQSQGLHVVSVDKSASFDDAAVATLDAMRGGADVIYQATFVDGEWLGRADFLRKVSRASSFGGWSYEVEDTKLARRPKSYFLLQLCFYTGQVERLQGTTPELMHVVLGTSERVSFRYRDFDAYYRRVRSRFHEAVRDAPQTYPYPVGHCALCDFKAHCEERWLRDDHLTLIPSMRRDHVGALEAGGVRTVARLAQSEGDVQGVGASALAAHRHHASLQVRARESGTPTYELLALEPGRGLQRLPRPSPGDIFFDMEGDPFFEAGRGLEYLFGFTTVETGEPRFQAWWAHDRAREKAVFEQFVDFVADRRRRWPDMHVYHYASYEPSTIGRLMGFHGTREDAVNDLLRQDVFVDLYQIVRQAMRTSLPGYSIKKVRCFFMDVEAGGVADAAESIIAYERWCSSGDDAELAAIAAYNDEDCLSNLRLRDWLLELRAEAGKRFEQRLAWQEAPDVRPPDVDKAERIDLRQRIERRLGDRASADSAQERTWTLLSNLLEYHRREAKPEWWAYFDRLEASDEELLDNPDAIAGLVPTGLIEPEKRSHVHTLRFPPQEQQLSGAEVDDPRTRTKAGVLVSVDDRAGTLKLKRGPRFEGTALPTALVAGGPPPTAAQQSALLMIGFAALADGVEAGQIALADALAMSAAARNVILLGDPMQLAQVSTGSHPPGAGLSVLEHLLGSRATVAQADGIFLERSWRMHPRVCRFISDAIYDGRLTSEPRCAQQQLACEGWPPAGIRFRPVGHVGNSQRSEEEAAVIAGEVEQLLTAGLYTDHGVAKRHVSLADIMVVAAYNQQVNCLRDRLPVGARVGTVDKFQGQEAPIVFYSMACSSAEEVPRGLEFLFSRNRLNVAVSRAQCIATVVASPRLLDAACRTPEQMQLVSALCALAEYAAAADVA